MILGAVGISGADSGDDVHESRALSSNISDAAKIIQLLPLSK